METVGTENLGGGLPFDTLAMAKHLRGHGYTKEQAEGQVELLKHVVESNLATKTDIAEIKVEIEQLRSDTKRDIEGLRKELRTDIAEVRRDMKEMEYRMTIRLGGMMAAIAGFFIVMDKFF